MNVIFHDVRHVPPTDMPESLVFDLRSSLPDVPPGDVFQPDILDLADGDELPVHFDQLDVVPVYAKASKFPLNARLAT